MRILIVEDHEEIRSSMASSLRARGDSVDEVGTVREARQYLQHAHYDIAVLDRMLPDGDSISLLKLVRSKNDQTPVLMLTARDKIEDRVEGLEAGADDYLVKPFSMRELLARVGVLVRRDNLPRASIVKIGSLEIDNGRREVRRDGVLIPLRPKEYTLLELLASRAGRAVSRDDILESCWDTLESPSSNVEETLIASLRRKIGPPGMIKTVRGLGYMIDEADEQ